MCRVSDDSGYSLRAELALLACMSGNRQFVEHERPRLRPRRQGRGQARPGARALVEESWNTRQGCISVQVLQEFFVTTTRKSPTSRSMPRQPHGSIGDLAHWRAGTLPPLATSSRPSIPTSELAAIDTHQRAGSVLPGCDDPPQRKGTRLRNPALGGSQPRARCTRASRSATRSWPSRQGSPAPDSCLCAGL